jgi:hypothetical protein
MARVTLDQIEVPLRVSGSQLIASASFVVSGSATVIQTNPTVPSLRVSGSFYVVDSPGVESGSYNGNAIDGGTY